MIHKNSTIFKKTGWRQYEMTNPINLKDGDIVRGFNPKTQKYEDIKIMSILKVNNQRVLVKTSSLDNIVISIDSFMASSNNFWCIKDLTNKKQFKMIKKDPSIHGANLFTPYILSAIQEHNDIFYDIRTNSECPVLVDSYLQYFKSMESGKYGFETEINGSECITSSLDAEQRTLRVPEESES